MSNGGSSRREFNIILLIKIGIWVVVVVVARVSSLEPTQSNPEELVDILLIKIFPLHGL